MKILWDKPAPPGEFPVERVRFAIGRTFLCSLVLACLALLLALLAGRIAGTPTAVRVGLWLLLAGSCVVSGYAFYALMSARQEAPPPRRVDSGLVDALTGLPNRQGLIAELETSYRSSGAGSRRTWLVDVDLVGLSKVNKEFGHLTGDAVLQDVANLLRGAAPPGCIVGRLGGDEFLIVMPGAEPAAAEALAGSLKELFRDYRLDLGKRGQVSSVRAVISQAVYVPELASLHETLVSAKESTAQLAVGAASEGESFRYYHAPRVTLGAFAVHRWDELTLEQQDAYKGWRRDLNADTTEQMAAEIVKLLEEKAEAYVADFVTAVPFVGAATAGARHAPRRLAQEVAQQLGLPYRDVLRGHISGAEDRSVEPAVDAVIRKGESALLVTDVIGSGILERKCVRSLSAAGAHVQVVAWATH